MVVVAECGKPGHLKRRVVVHRLELVPELLVVHARHPRAVEVVPQRRDELDGARLAAHDMPRATDICDSPPTFMPRTPQSPMVKKLRAPKGAGGRGRDTPSPSQATVFA